MLWLLWLHIFSDHFILLLFPSRIDLQYYIFTLFALPELTLLNYSSSISIIIFFLLLGNIGPFYIYFLYDLTPKIFKPTVFIDWVKSLLLPILCPPFKLMLFRKIKISLGLKCCLFVILLVRLWALIVIFEFLLSNSILNFPI